MLKPVQQDGSVSGRIATTAGLAADMAEGGLLLTALGEAHREPLRAACAQDSDIWRIYATSYDPEHFDGSFDLLRTRPNWQGFAILLGGELAGMSAFIGIDPDRGALEIGNTYYVPRLRGPASTAGQGPDAERGRSAADSGGSSSESTPATAARRRRWRRSAGFAKACSAGPDHLDRPCPRHRPLLHPRRRMEVGRWRLTISSSRSPPG
jgi:hypothetical protein